MTDHPPLPSPASWLAWAQRPCAITGYVLLAVAWLLHKLWLIYPAFLLTWVGLRLLPYLVRRLAAVAEAVEADPPLTEADMARHEATKAVLAQFARELEASRDQPDWLTDAMAQRPPGYRLH